MTFEEQLTRAFDTLTERLRGDIQLQVERTSAELLADMPPVRAAAEEPAAAVAPDAGAAVASRARLNDAVRSLDHARSLTEILDTLVSCAQMEAARADLWLIRGGRLHEWRPAPHDAAGPSSPSPADDGIVADAARTNAVAVNDGGLAVPLAIAGQAVAVLRAEVGRGKPDARSQDLEFLARYAARCLESLTAFTAARALTAPAGQDAAPAPRPADEPDMEEAASARRYARLLVSEIKLYHEPTVIDGRRDRDLLTRLGGEIARARAMYEQRVPPDVRHHGDYFHDELVRTLADGDASLLEVRS